MTNKASGQLIRVHAPHLLTKALLLTEDRRFYQHHGIDLVSTLRAFLVNLNARRYAQGGSTITQQLARTLYLHNRKTLWRKAREAFYAVWLELKYSKAQILRMYVSKVYMGQKRSGQPILGFDDAAHWYFKKSLNGCDLAEQAALIAMLKGPGIYGPRSAAGVARRTAVLALMLENGLITKDQFFQASQEEL